MLYENFRTEVCLRYSRKYVIEDTWYTPAADNMKKVCTDIPKWKYLSGISKEQRLRDQAEEEAAALEEQQRSQISLNLEQVQQNLDQQQELDLQEEQEEEEEEELENTETSAII